MSSFKGWCFYRYPVPVNGVIVFVACLSLIFLCNMGDFSDDIFSVFDENAEEPTPITKFDEKPFIKEVTLQPEAK